MALKKRVAPVGLNAPAGPAWIDPTFCEDYAGIYAFLHDEKYDDGSLRLVGSLSLFCKSGVLTCAINDNDRNLVAFVVGGTVEELLFTVNEMICNDSAEWKARQRGPGSNKPTF